VIDVSILVRCFEHNEFTSLTLATIRETATTRYELICQPNRASAAVNSNRLLDDAASDRVILLDDDIGCLQKGWDARLLDTLERYPGVGCVAPRLVDRGGQLLGPSRFVRPGCVVTGFEVWGAVLAFRRSQLRYDEAYLRTQCDDTDFLLQHLTAGRLLAIDGAVDLVHMREVSRDPAAPWFAHNYRHFLEKWGLQGRQIAWGEYVEWRSPTDCAVGFPSDLMPPASP